MATCEEVELRLIELFRGKPSEDLVLHLEACASCREKQEKWKQLWSLMDRWEDDEPSSKLEESILSEIRTELQREAVRRRRLSWSNVARTLGPLLAAMAVSFVGVALAVKTVGPALEPLSPLALLTCGVIWMAVYSVMFLFSFEKAGGAHRIQGIQTSILARYALLALGIWLLFAGLTEGTSIGKFATELYSPRIGVSWYFFVGTAYSFIPLVSVSLFIRGKQLTPASAHGLLLGAFFLFLLAPEIFLYCGTFSLGIAFSWTVGTIMGCAIGGPAAVWLGRKRIEVVGKFSAYV